MLVKKFSFESFLPKRLSQQIFVILFVVVVIPVLVLGFVLTQVSQRSLRNNIEANMRSIAIHASGELTERYVSAYQSLRLTSFLLAAGKADQWSQETVLVELALRMPVFKFLIAFDQHQRVVARSTIGMGDKQLYDTEVMQCAYQQARCISPVRNALDHLPYVDLAVPINRYGKTIGVLYGRYSLVGVWDLLDQMNHENDMQVMLIDREGKILAHPDKKKVLKNEVLPFKSIIPLVTKGYSGAGIQRLANGSIWVVAYAPIDIINSGLIVVQGYDQAFALISALKAHSWIIVLLSLIALLIVMYLLSKRMSAPIEELIVRVKSISRLDVKQEWPIVRRDEFGRLSFALKQMMHQIIKARQIERLSIVGRSAASIAHELKNSLTLITTLIQVLPERHRDKSFVKESTETVLKELDSWRLMLKNITDFTKEKMVLTVAPVDLARLIDEVGVLARLKADQLNIAFKITHDNRIPLFNGDYERLKQVLFNLIANAFESVGADDLIEIKIQFIGKVEQSYVEIMVRNTGPAVKEEDLNKIFDPFYSTKDGGLGLGLSICRDIIHRHAGRLDVENEIGKGVRFIIKLPLYHYLSNQQLPSRLYDIR